MNSSTLLIRSATMKLLTLFQKAPGQNDLEIEYFSSIHNTLEAIIVKLKIPAKDNFQKVPVTINVSQAKENILKALREMKFLL